MAEPIPESAQAVTVPAGRAEWSWAISDTRLHVNTEAIAYSVAGFAGDHELAHVAFFSVRQLGQRAGFAEKTVSRHLRKLKYGRWISTTSRRGVYLLTVPVTTP
jgi:hypothetical protein